MPVGCCHSTVACSARAVPGYEVDCQLLETTHKDRQHRQLFRFALVIRHDRRRQSRKVLPTALRCLGTSWDTWDMDGGGWAGGFLLGLSFRMLV